MVNQIYHFYTICISKQNCRRLHGKFWRLNLYFYRQITWIQKSQSRIKNKQICSKLINRENYHFYTICISHQNCRRLHGQFWQLDIYLTVTSHVYESLKSRIKKKKIAQNWSTVKMTSFTLSAFPIKIAADYTVNFDDSASIFIVITTCAYKRSSNGLSNLCNNNIILNSLSGKCENDYII